MAGAPSRGMIFLDPRNKVITEYFTKKFADVKTKEVNDQKFAEFDGTRLWAGVGFRFVFGSVLADRDAINA
jgi:hypothetical protein